MGRSHQARTGFWPIGSTCTVGCADAGSGHRRQLQGAGATTSYLCTQGGDWVSAAPLTCGAGGPPATPTAGRFVAAPQSQSTALAAGGDNPPQSQHALTRRTGSSLSQPR